MYVHVHGSIVMTMIMTALPCLFLDLNVSVSSAMVSGEGSSYSCIVDGYPVVQLLMWRTGLGTDIQHQHNTTSVIAEFHSTVTSTLTVERDEMCRESRGYTCTFSKGGISPVVQSGIVHCSPGNV